MILATAHDLTDQWRAEAALRDRQDLLCKVLNLYDKLEQRLATTPGIARQSEQGHEGRSDAVSEASERQLVSEALAEIRRQIADL